MKHGVKFYFGFGSRYSYLAATQIAALEKDTGVRVAWLPMLSGALMNRRGQNPFAARDAAGNWSGVSISGQYNEEYRRTDLARWAKLYGVSYVEPRDPIMYTVRRTRFAVAAELQGFAAAFAPALFASIYEDGTATTEDDCLGIARGLGLSEKRLLADISSSAAQARYDEIVSVAMTEGVFGVPAFVTERELFWGNDRLVLLRAHLKISDA